MTRPVAGPASSSTVRLSALTTVLMHVVPIGIIQVADYVSDIFVVLDFYEHAKKTSDPDDALWWQVGLGFICGSVLAAFVLCIMVFIFQRQARINGDNAIPLWHIGWVALLAPFNLHVLYLGVAQGRTKAAAEELKHESARSAAELWREFDGAAERLDDAARRGSLEDFQQASTDYESAISRLKRDPATEVYLAKAGQASILNLLFVMTKALETVRSLSHPALPLCV